jgi:pimeloyl-ACP methyl ester carboxylesterase
LPDASRAATRSRAPRARRRARRIRSLIGALCAVLLLAILAFAVYASTPFQPESAPLDRVRADTSLLVTESADAVILAPREGATGEGLVFLAGARVSPAAYADKLSGLAEAGLTVVIARPVFGFAILEWRPFTEFADLAPTVDRWLVGGHSLGGVRACQYVADQPVNQRGDSRVDSGVDDAAATTTPIVGLVFFGSYCAADISTSNVPVLSIAAANDGLSTTEKIEDAAPLLPGDAVFTEIAGANHASFGDYGVQPGDGTATADDAAVRDAITDAVLAFD